MGATLQDAYGRNEQKQRRKYSPVAGVFVRLIKEKPFGTVGVAIILVFLLVSVFANLIAPYGMNEPDVLNRLAAPGGAHILGTDNLGRDLLSRVIYGARISMYVGFGASCLAVFLSTIIGLISGYFGGTTDILLQRFVDAFMCFPPIFLILAIMSVAGGGIFQVIIVLGLLTGISRARIVRSAVLTIKGNAFVEAGRAIGAPDRQILIRHVLPNVMATIIILFTINIGTAIITEATVSFLGFGIPPPVPSWGGMLSGSGRKYMLEAPWMALWPGLALALVVYGINMFGDALRDILDPRLRGGLGRYDVKKLKRTGRKSS